MDVTILNNSDFVTPSIVQNSIKEKFAFSKNKEVEVRFDKEEKSFDIYQNEQFVCSFDEKGNEI
jgi:hypothetical protein